MKKLSFIELCELIKTHNEERGVKTQYGDDKPLKCVVVFSSSNWDKDYDLDNRSYVFRSDEKRFVPNLLGTSIFADNLDKSDYIRLDWYINEWAIDYCYIMED